jgi:endonuclease/exonuclease/phosphatase family metal-dependent hydrolase
MMSDATPMTLLTWNIQAGIGTSRMLEYLIHAHRQIVHTPSKTVALRNIARVIAPYDLVCLQEIDLGGRRAGFRSQLDVLTALSGHAHIAVQHNRTVPGISRHGNAILSRWPLTNIHDLKLPGRIGGRGCVIADVAGPAPMRVACLHLSLGAAAQAQQLASIAERLRDAPAWVAMGDFNCTATSAPMQGFCTMTGGTLPTPAPCTYPSWRPRHDYDHIVGSPGLPLVRNGPLTARLSDHLALTASVSM